RARSQPLDQTAHFLARERRALAFLPDDLLRQHFHDPQSCIGISERNALSNRIMSPAAFSPSCLVSAWLGDAPSIPAPRLVMTESAATLSPKRRPRITSGTVDMPTASAPSRCAMRISAGVSKLGPEDHIYVPSRSAIPVALAARRKPAASPAS